MGQTEVPHTLGTRATVRPCSRRGPDGAGAPWGPGGLCEAARRPNGRRQVVARKPIAGKDFKGETANRPQHHRLVPACQSGGLGAVGVVVLGLDADQETGYFPVHHFCQRKPCP
jgi:hypothetical protein